MGNSDKEGPRARLGHHAKAKTHGPWSGHPEPVGLDPEPRLSTQHQVKVVGELPWSWAGAMTKARPRSPEYQEHVATDPVMEAVTEPGGSKGTRQFDDVWDDYLKILNFTYSYLNDRAIREDACGSNDVLIDGDDTDSSKESEKEATPNVEVEIPPCRGLGLVHQA
ncbi:hypothetical protein Sjap_015161 [Stephania japonica]|uniref:Uncharacterized protein n=1 Tax=Stephania japonica TaxID=461633 RepID=A0AAP0NS85_9MAGN